jgi:DNA-binding CsgD family transcriptional regulator
MDDSSRFVQVGSRAVDRREKTMQQLEEEADGILEGLDGSMRVYSEKQLARKIRLEECRMPVVGETDLPAEVADYLLACQLRHMIETARLTRLQGAVMGCVLMGWSAEEIASRFGIALQKVKRALKAARRRIAQRGSHYDGLYEVYWSEVHRYVYRKPAGR